jgi:hypothetical protein
MARVFALVAIGCAAYALLNRIDASSHGVNVEGREVRVETADLDARFSRIGALSDSYMLFGGTNRQPRNSVGHATLAALAMRHAEEIHQSYPDFDRCSSPGAAQAKQWLETMTMIAATRSAEKVLVKAIDLHAERVRGNGERTCVSISGAPLSLESVSLKQDGRDLTHEFGGALGRVDFYLAEHAELLDCATLLR